MLLGLSGEHHDGEVSLDGLSGTGDGDGGIRHGAVLVRLVEAMWAGESGGLAAAREAVLEAAGADVLVDAVAVSANFHMMTRVADGTGTPLDPTTDELSAPWRDGIGVDGFASRRHVPAG